MASKRVNKWRKHHDDLTHGAWYLPFENRKKEYEIIHDDVSGSLSYCPECNFVYDSIQSQMRVNGKVINARKIFFYHDFPNLVKDSKHKACYRCLGKPCKIVDRM
tara:strand:- start:365 stop:679 length:315 start_codon:yes stop_codon:yes gene_type:complete